MLFVCFSAGAQSVGVVLSGGGAKGLSHVGVIKALEENNIPIDYIAGTSMGAIVAGLYAIGLTPDEMLALFRSRDFASWYQGQFEEGYATYVYRRPLTSGMVSVGISRKSEEEGLKFNLPTSVVSPYPMDLAVMQMFASSAAVADYNFDNLMVPFRCVSSDVANKKSFISRSGDLGSAIRASMTYPFLFKPITIDSTLLFDGGFYNNFPWDIMIDDFDPDFIIGVKCVEGTTDLDSENIITQVSSLLTGITDYTIPEERGLLIEADFSDISIMDFNKVDEIVQRGYDGAMEYITDIRSRVDRRISEAEMLKNRMDFRTQTMPLNFDTIYVRGDLSDSEKRFIVRTLKNDSEGIVTFDELKRGYYRVIATGNINTFYPFAKRANDSSFNLYIDASRAAPLKISIGGNVSSSSLNQGYIGIEYKRFSPKPLTLAMDGDLGRFYSGLNLYLRQDMGIKPLWFYETQFTVHRFDYFVGNQREFFANRLVSNIQESEIYATASVGTPVNFEKNVLGKLNVNVGRTLYEYYKSDDYTSKDIPDRTGSWYISNSLGLERNTLSHPIYPTEGLSQRVVLRYTYLYERHVPGRSPGEVRPPLVRNNHNILSAKIYSESYFNIFQGFKLGLLADIVLSNASAMGDYTSTLLSLQSFQPTPHSQTILTSANRASTYAGVAVMPIFKFSNSLFLHTQISYFQPYKRLIEVSDNTVTFSAPLPTGSFMGSVAAVWHSPVGSISLSVSYYDKPGVKWFPQLDVGFLLFKSKALNN